MKLIVSAAYQKKIATKLRESSVAKAKVLRAAGESRDVWKQILATRLSAFPPKSS